MKFRNIVGGTWHGELELSRNWVPFGAGLNNENENYKLIGVLGIGMATWLDGVAFAAGAVDGNRGELTDASLHSCGWLGIVNPSEIRGNVQLKVTYTKYTSFY